MRDAQSRRWECRGARQDEHLRIEVSVPEANDASDLYRLDPEKFTAARNALVKRLRAGGEKKEAETVAKLRRPSATAWALNQLAATNPEVIDLVLEAGANLRSAMEAAVGGDASGLRLAQQAERAAVEAGLSAGAERLGRAGHRAGDPARQRMAGTLRAAFTDEAIADQLRAGTLDADYDASGFGLDPATVQLPARRNDTAEEQVEDARRAARLAEVARLLHRAERLEQEAERAEERATQARQAATQAAEEARQAGSEPGE
jgi:hypothetical protein